MATQRAALEQVEIIRPCIHAGKEYQIGDRPVLPAREAAKLIDRGTAQPPKDTPRQTTAKPRSKK